MSTTTPTTRTGRFASYLDDRTGIAGAVKEFGRKVFPDHWSFMLGEVALYSFVALVLSGTFLTLFFQPSMAEVTYDGSYLPMQGLHMSTAFASTLDISFDIRGGMLMRQVHHWAALLFIASAGLHMLRIFFTGAFRKPRELNWLIGFFLFILGMGAGFTGYSLPDDLLSGNGLRIIDGMMKGIPLVGTWISFFLFGGEFPGTEIVGRLYMMHIMVIPALIIALVAVHLLFVVLHKHTQYPGPGRKESNVVGYPLMPVYVGKAGGFFFIVFGVIMLIASFFTINPIWNYGPYDPSPVSAGTQPDWYIGFADGMLRLIPPHLQVTGLGGTWMFYILIPMIVLGGFLALVACYPFIEAKVTKDERYHNVLDRPRNAPTRTAIGAAGVTLYAVMWSAASSDVLSTHFHLDVFQLTHFLQISLFVAPIIAYFIAKRVALALQKRDRALVLHGRETGNIVRLPHGEYIEIHEPLNEYERWRLVSFDTYKPIMPRPDDNGRITFGTRLRSRMSRWFFEDRIEPVTPKELEEGHEGH